MIEIDLISVWGLGIDFNFSVEIAIEGVSEENRKSKKKIEITSFL